MIGKRLLALAHCVGVGNVLLASLLTNLSSYRRRPRRRTTLVRRLSWRRNTPVSTSRTRDDKNVVAPADEPRLDKNVQATDAPFSSIISANSQSLPLHFRPTDAHNFT